MKPIFLIGYMGTGKSTLGHAVSGLTGIRFVDMDDLIEERAGMSVREIFSSRGEDEFRRLERDTLIELASQEDVIIACGGGTPCFNDNMELMNGSGVTVWLQAPIEVLHRRLVEGRNKRPLIAGMKDDELYRYIIGALRSREIFYASATDRFDSCRLETAEEINETASRFINQFITHND